MALGALLAALAAAGLLVALGQSTAPVGVAIVVLAAPASAGFLVVQPNDSRVLVLLGRYTGSVVEPGFFYVNPFSAVWRHSVSLRVRNFQTDRLKVNDASGSPIEIAAVVVRRVVDTARAVFDVDQFEEFVTVQSETAVRHLASRYPYDAHDDQPSLLMALRELGEQGTVRLDDERKAAMAANLMLVLTSDRGATPVIDAGT